MKTHQGDLTELRQLIERAETVVANLGRMVPPEANWMEWRHKRLARRLDEVRCELERMAEKMQILMIEKVVETKRMGGKGR